MNYINVFNRYYTPRLRLMRTGRKKKSTYKIVVVNFDNRIIGDLGYIIPHAVNKKKFIKKIGLDRSKSILWLLKKASPSLIVFFIFENIGLVKYVGQNYLYYDKH